MPLAESQVRFGDFELDLTSAELRNNDHKIRLQEQPFHILVALLERPGELVTRDELRHRLWPNDVHVDYERSLNTAVKRLRQSLGDEADEPRYIETLPRHGYRFIGHVKDSLHVSAAPHRSLKRWVAFFAAVLVIFAFGLYQGRQLWDWIFPEKIRSIAVLPLQNLSHDPTQDYLSDGMTEALISELSRLDPLRVISFTSVMRYKNTSKPLPEIARELNVDGIVEGSVIHEGDRLRIRSRLVSVRGDRTIWTESYDRDMRDILALQTEVAHTIASQIQINLSTPHKIRAANLKRIDPEVHEAFLQGKYFLNRADLPQSQKAFETAIAKDPRFAPAYAGLASTLTMTLPASAEIISKARAMAHQALSLDDSLAEAHMALGTIYLVFDWNWLAAEKELKLALQLDPGSAVAHDQYAYYLVATGHSSEAVAEARQALRLDPLSLNVSNNYGRMLYFNRQYDAAIEQFTQSLQLDPRAPMAYMMRGYTRQAIGQYDAAFADFRKAWTFMGNKRGLEILDQYDRTKDRVEAIRAIAKLFESGIPSGKAQPSSVAMAYLQIGDIDKTFEFLELGYRMRTRSFFYINAIPEFDSIRSDPRFKDLLQRMNLVR